MIGRAWVQERAWSFSRGVRSWVIHHQFSIMHAHGISRRAASAGPEVVLEVSLFRSMRAEGVLGFKALGFGFRSLGLRLWA